MKYLWRLYYLVKKPKTKSEMLRQCDRLSGSECIELSQVREMGDMTDLSANKTLESIIPIYKLWKTMETERVKSCGSEAHTVAWENYQKAFEQESKERRKRKSIKNK